MPISIKNPETEQLARKLADWTGESITHAIHESLKERLQNLEDAESRKMMKEDILEIVRHCASLPVLSTLSEDEILGYDEFGVPSR